MTLPDVTTVRKARDVVEGRIARVVASIAERDAMGMAPDDLLPALRLLETARADLERILTDAQRRAGDARLREMGA